MTIQDHGLPVFRQVWRGHLADGSEPTELETLRTHLQSLVATEQLLTASLFRWEQRLFLYVEAVGVAADPEDLTASLHKDLACWPGESNPRHWVPMTDIFHYHQCLGASQWARKTTPVSRIGRVMRIRPEMAASYIFLHYQLQEERPASGDKYGLINLHEDLMFFYLEEPAVVEAPLYEGGLSTKNTPGDWHTLMARHFQPWTKDDVDPQWRPVDCLFAQ